MKLDFLKYTRVYFGISIVVILIGFFYLASYGLKPSIDFTGGSLVELEFQEPDANLSDSQLKDSLATTNINIASIQQTGNNSYLFRTQELSTSQADELKETLRQEFGSLSELRFETVGPVLGQELLRKTYIGITISTLLILAYVGYRFTNVKFGVAAVVAMIHDAFVVIGTAAVMGHYYGMEIDALFVTALLTTLSFSVHDTIVVYDRIRETTKLHPRANFRAVVNKSIAETMGRSVNNSLTIIFMLTSLFLLGGDSTRWFVFTLLVGTITGTYSSPFISAPVLVVWQEWQAKRKRS